MKKKLTIDEQIIDLEEKGVTFNIMNDDEAKIFLRYNNYPKLFTEQYLN